MRFSEQAKLWKSPRKFYYRFEVNVFFMITHMIWQFAILFSNIIRKFSFDMNKFCVKIKKLFVTILKSRIKFQWSSNVPGQ